MALIIKDRVLETCSSPGTGAVTLLGAATGYQTFNAAIGNGNTCYYTIADQSGSNWEVGIGTFASPATLSRTTVLASSNGGTVVNFNSGTQNVFETYPAGKAVTTDTLAYPPAIGGTTPNSGAFTSLSATGTTTLATSLTGVLKAAAGVVSSTATLAVGDGGTGSSTLTLNNVLLGNGTSALQVVAPGTAGNVLTSNGTTWTSSAASGVTTFSAGTTGFTPSTATSGAVTLAGTLAVANGGTGQTSYTDGQLLIGNSTGNTLTKATLTAGSGITITNGAGSITISGGFSTGKAIVISSIFGG